MSSSEAPSPEGAPAALTAKQRKALGALAHHLQPIVQVGKKGITDTLIAETARALLDHELIKVRFSGSEDLSADAAELAARADAQLVGTRGKVAIVYRPHPDDPRVRVPG